MIEQNTSNFTLVKLYNNQKEQKELFDKENKIMTQNLLKKLALLKIDVKKFHCYNRDRKK